MTESSADGDGETQLSDGFVKLVAESICISNISEECSRIIAQEGSFRLKALIEEAAKFARHARRRTLIGADIDGALRRMNVEPVFGFASSDGLPFRQISTGGRLGGELHITDDRELDLNACVNAAVPKAPLDIQLKAHWLVIDGVQPSIPENPCSSVGARDDGEAGSSAALDVLAVAGSSKGAANQRRQTHEQTVHVRSLSARGLSVEQQAYFKEVTEACIGPDDLKRNEALESLKTDTGLQAVFPRLVVFIVEGVKCNIVAANLAVLIYLMRVTRALVDNRAVSLEKYLHDLVPAMLNCVLSRQLGASQQADSHYSVRDFGARLLATLSKKYENGVNGLQARVLRVVNRVLADETNTVPLSVLYGALVYFDQMGTEAIRAFVVPRVPLLAERVFRALEDRSVHKATMAELSAAEHVRECLGKSLSNYVQRVRPDDLQSLADFKRQFGGFADDVYNVVNEGAKSISSSTLQHHAIPTTSIVAGSPVTQTLPLGPKRQKAGAGPITSERRQSTGVFLPLPSTPRYVIQQRSFAGGSTIGRGVLPSRPRVPLGRMYQMPGAQHDYVSYGAGRLTSSASQSQISPTDSVSSNEGPSWTHVDRRRMRPVGDDSRSCSPLLASVTATGHTTQHARSHSPPEHFTGR